MTTTLRSFAFLSFFAAFGLVACADELPNQTTGTGGSGAQGGSGQGGAGGSGGQGGSGAGPDDLLDTLKAIPDLTVDEVSSPVAGARLFEITITQPEDHDNPQSPTFQQHLSLLHRSADAPMVVFSTGYYKADGGYEDEITAVFETNQISVEHRFFAPSIPDNPDWSKLTIEQSAADYHHIAEVFHPLYQGKWLATGGSKGGMTSVYFRRFYPDDVDVTVPYVAPNSLGAPDPRYPIFLSQVGDPACRAAVEDVQREFLLRRPAMKAQMLDLASQFGATFDVLGVDKALEHAAIETGFAFWQYYGSSNCDMVPSTGASDQDIFQFVADVSSAYYYSDEGVQAFVPYYYQAAAQLGYPAPKEDIVSDLLMFPGTDVATSYLPGVPMPTFDPASMQDIAAWVATEGQRFLFIYGQNDPWSAGAFTFGNANDSYLYTVPDGTHGSAINDLPLPERDAAFGKIAAWLGVSPQSPLPGKAPRALKAPRAREPFERRLTRHGI